MDSIEPILLSSILKHHWDKYTAYVRSSSDPTARGIWGNCAKSICDLAHDIERKAEVTFDWLPR